MPTTGKFLLDIESNTLYVANHQWIPQAVNEIYVFYDKKTQELFYVDRLIGFVQNCAKIYNFEDRGNIIIRGKNGTFCVKTYNKKLVKDCNKYSPTIKKMINKYRDVLYKLDLGLNVETLLRKGIRIRMSSSRI